MGGRAAELLTCGAVSTGAVDDIRRATDLAYRSVCEYGLSAAVGPLNVAVLAAGGGDEGGWLSVRDAGGTGRVVSWAGGGGWEGRGGRRRSRPSGAGVARGAGAVRRRPVRHARTGPGGAAPGASPRRLSAPARPPPPPLAPPLPPRQVEAEVKALLEGALAAAASVVDANQRLHASLSESLAAHERLEGPQLVGPLEGTEVRGAARHRCPAP